MGRGWELIFAKTFCQLLVIMIFPEICSSKYIKWNQVTISIIKYKINDYRQITFSTKMTDVYPPAIYLLKLNNKNTRIRWELSSKLTIKIPKQSGVIIVNFGLISHLVLLFLLSTLNM